MFNLRKIYKEAEKRFPSLFRLKDRLVFAKKFFTGKSRRYKYLKQAIKNRHPSRIMEIGTWNGRRAEWMIRWAQEYRKDIEYYGFDLFESFNRDKVEKYPKVPPSVGTVKDLLERSGAKIYLHMGDSREVLPRVAPTLRKMDLIFIDGGHDPAVIKSDWENVEPLIHEETVVFFDDYWNQDRMGCKRVVEAIDKGRYRVDVLPIEDIFDKGEEVLKIRFVRVDPL